jgi:predicted DNA binding CopG/RHH family protein
MEAVERRMFRRKQVDRMKRKLPPATLPLPNFRSDEAAAEYFETHSVADVWNGLPEGKPAKPSKALVDSIRQRHAAAKSPISIRLAAEQIAAAKRIAAAKSVGYQTQLRMWIAEGIRRDAKRA